MVHLIFGDCGEIMDHHRRVGQQTRLLTFKRRTQHCHTTWMIGPKQPAGNHRNNDLRAPCLEIISLNDKCLAQLGGT
jgi:hypothetical protein